jgi:hypothetical protein
VDDKNQGAEESSVVELDKAFFGLNVRVTVDHIRHVLGHESSSLFLCQLVQLILNFVQVVIESLDVEINASHSLKVKITILKSTSVMSPAISTRDLFLWNLLSSQEKFLM